MEQREEDVYKLLSNKECYIFIAGNAKDMPAAVKEVFIKIFEKFENLSNTKSLKIMEMMESKGYYQTETWN